MVEVERAEWVEAHHEFFRFETCIIRKTERRSVFIFLLQTSSVTWRMRAPEKKPLVNLEKDDRVPQLQRAEKVKQESPIQLLSEFGTSEVKRQPDFY